MSSVPPGPPPAALLHALGEWRRDRRGAVVAAVVIVALGAVMAVLGGTDGTAAGDGPGLRGVVTGAVTAATLTTLLLATITHVGMARARWFGHLARYPGLLVETLRVPGTGVRVLGGLVGGVVLATFLHPVLGLALAALALGVLPTEVGRAIAAWRTTGGAVRARVVGRRSTTDPARWRLTAVTLALGAAPVALLRFLVLEPACDLDRWLGAGCPDGAVATTATVGALVLATVAVTPLAIGLGDVLSRTLAGERLGTSAPEPPRHVEVLVPEPPAAPPAPVAEPAVEPRRVPAAGPVPDVAPPAVPEPGVDPEPVVAPAPREVSEPAVAPDAVAREVPPLWPDDRPVADFEEPVPGRDGDDDGEPTVEIPPFRPAPEADVDPEPGPEPGPEPEPGPGPEPEPEPPAEVQPDRDAERIDRAVDRARPSLESLTEPTRAVAVSLFASLGGGDVDPGADAIEELRRSLQGLDIDDTRATLSLVRANAGRVEALRSQYRRSPRIARGAIERTASVGFRAAGLPGEHAESLAATLLTVDDEDWAHLSAALEALDAELDRT